MINWDRVMELRSEIGPDDFAEVAQMFLEEADDVVLRLSANDDAKTMESNLHFLKGSALNLGFGALSTLCQDGERRAAGGDTSIDVDAVRTVYFASKSAFEARMATAFAA